MTKPKPAPALFIVDDDQGLLRLTAKTLGREGYSISTAASGEEAVAWLRENQPDLLLLD
jgi:CheY-like chemotaxis protein